MIDLDREFRALDRIDVPALESDIDARARLPERQEVPRASAGRRRVAAVVALCVFAVAAAFAWSVWERTAPTDPAQPSPTGDPWAWAPQGWTELPQPPGDRESATYVWTKDQLLYWGGGPRVVHGEASPFADGYAFDARTRAWSAIPAAPVPGVRSLGIWTGSEALFLPQNEEVLLAYEPVGRTWRRLADPIHHVDRPAYAWTGRELIVWGGGRKGEPTTHEGAAYDPENDAWRRISDAPLEMTAANAVWTGREMVVVGSELDRGNNASSRTALALAYDPVDDRWRRLADPPVSPQTSGVELVDGRLIAWDAYTPASAEYIPTADRWRGLDMGPVEGHDVCYTDGDAADGVLFAWNCGSPAAWSPSSSWQLVGNPNDIENPRLRIQIGFVVGVGSAVAVDQADTLLTPGGQPEIGSLEAPVHLWLWKPPAEP